MEEKDDYKISMPHRHTVIYEEEELEVEFETELAIDGIIFYTKSGKVLRGKTSNVELITDLVSNWLIKKFNECKVYLDNS